MHETEVAGAVNIGLLTFIVPIDSWDSKRKS